MKCKQYNIIASVHHYDKLYAPHEKVFCRQNQIFCDSVQSQAKIK